MPSLVQIEDSSSSLSVDINCTDCTLIENKYKNINQYVIDDDISILSFQGYPIDTDSLTSPPSLIVSHKTPEQIDTLYYNYKQIIESNEKQYNREFLPEDEIYYECNQIKHQSTDNDNDVFHDAHENTRRKVFHLAVDHQFLTREKGKGKSLHTTQDKVDNILIDMDWSELVGEHESFSTLAYAISTVEKFQKLENIQPNLAWKPIEVIKRTLEETIQRASSILSFPMKNHNVSCFPWAKKFRLQEKIATDTVFCTTLGIGGFNCARIFVRLMLRMINVYPMPSKQEGNIVK